jgi:hypothetical protein
LGLTVQRSIHALHNPIMSFARYSRYLPAPAAAAPAAFWEAPARIFKFSGDFVKKIIFPSGRSFFLLAGVAFPGVSELRILLYQELGTSAAF